MKSRNKHEETDGCHHVHDNNVITPVALRRSHRGSGGGSGGTIQADIFPPPKVSSEVTRASRKIDPAALPEAATRLLFRQDTEELTCLSFGLSSCFDGHKDVMCDQYLNVCASSLENSLKKKKETVSSNAKKHGITNTRREDKL